MEKILNAFQNKDLTDYRSIPFWSWNAKLEPEELRRQIRWMHDNGMGGFFMHARTGLITEYLSEDWMQCVEACADEAEKLGMNAWIYDENGWPSGFAGGKLLEDPANRDQYILADTGDFDPNATVSYCLDGDALCRVTAGELGKQYLNLTIHIAVSTADILNPKVVDQFLALTHEAYKARFGADFGKKVKGFFTDEPQYQRWHTAYTPMVAEYFRDHYDQDILDSLGLLFVEKTGWRQFRYRYWKAMQTLLTENFSKRIYDWCEEQGVKFTGHYIEEGSLSGQMACCAGLMPMYEYEHIPGIDWLWRGCGSELSPRQVSSVAQQLGKKQVLTETFALCGWDVTPRQLQRIAGFQYANGVNLMCQHLLPYSERGTRKHDYPSHYSPVNPWVRTFFKDFNDYFTKLGYLLANGKEQVNVAMLHPMRSAYLVYDRNLGEPGGLGGGTEELDADLRTACRALSSRSIAYHFLDETLLGKYGFVRDGKIGCGKCEYDYLVLPTTLTIDASTEKFLRAYVEQGGKLLLLGDKPQWVEGEDFDFSYLTTNTSLEEIAAAQPFCVKETDHSLYTAYRSYEGQDFLFVQNASDTDSCTQTFCFGPEIRSFRKLDLLTMETESVPLTVTLKANQNALLIPSREEVPQQSPVPVHHLRLNNAKVSFKENYLTVDAIRWSADGVNYSEPTPYAGLFQHLLESRYEGKIFLRYEFEVRKKPAKLVLRAEECGALRVTFNETEITGTPAAEIEKSVLAYDITALVQEGKNVFVVERSWYEKPLVYHALFGENVTESLRNCIVYDSEVEPIWLAGQFGVYPTDGYAKTEDARFVSAENFYIGEVPTSVEKEPTVEGLPFFAGELTAVQTVKLSAGKNRLVVDGHYMTARVWLNGEPAGDLLFDTELDVMAKDGDNEIRITYWVDNRNLMGPQHLNGPKVQPVTPFAFQLPGGWENGKHPRYHTAYDLRCMYEAD